jgi:hypothetical protein
MMFPLPQTSVPTGYGRSGGQSACCADIDKFCNGESKIGRLVAVRSNSPSSAKTCSQTGHLARREEMGLSRYPTATIVLGGMCRSSAVCCIFLRRSGVHFGGKCF